VELAKYQYFFENFFKNAKYLLANKLENQLSKVEGSRTDIYDLYDSLAYADRKLTYLVYKNKRETLTLPLYQHILENSSPAEDQLLRNKVAKLYTSQFADHKHSFAKIYSSIVKLNLEEVKIRKFKHFLNYYLDKDDVSQKMYFQLLASGKRVVPFYKKYIKLKQVFLKLKKIYLSDNQLILFPEIEPK
jgi:oligoendopeptidase F